MVTEKQSGPLEILLELRFSTTDYVSLKVERLQNCIVGLFADCIPFA